MTTIVQTLREINEPPPGFGYGQQDHGPRVPATAPPTRPSSRTNMIDASQPPDYENATTQSSQGNTGNAGSDQKMSLAQREERELQQAVAMSLNQGMSKQETGVTTSKQAQFGKATRDEYDTNSWAMTLFNTTSEEVVLSPDPEDRKRIAGEPAFIRPSSNNLYLGGFLTILHEIPLAREALMLRNKVLFDYGQESQEWWNGQPINLPKIVTVGEGDNADNDWDDIIYETQRLMAFLDSTNRSFGSSDALAGLRHLHDYSSDSEEAITRFLETWHRAALRADPENPLSMIFQSKAYKRTPFDDPADEDEPISRELYIFEPQVEQDHGQNLYDVLDTAIWSDRPGENMDDVWLEHLGELLIMKLDSYENAKSVDVKVPAVFYPDRYMSSCRELALEFRTKRREVMEEIQELEKLMTRFTAPRTAVGTLTVKEILEKAAQAVPVVLSEDSVQNDDAMIPEVKAEKASRITRDLQEIAQKVEAKLKDLESKKQKALETMRTYSKTLTEPSDSPGEPPIHKYTLRGVCTEPHVTYVLRSERASDPNDLMELDNQSDAQDQWWRISYSAEDGKTRQAEKRDAQGNQSASQHGDVIGYTARKVREVEVLHAAREEWRTVLLVYASDNAMNAKVEAAPRQLQGFVRKDNEAFATECEENATNAQDAQVTDSSGKNNSMSVQYDSSQEREKEQDQPINVFDYEVSDFDSERGSGKEKEMQEKPRASLIGNSANASNQAKVSQALDDNSEWNVDEDEEMVDHVETAKS
ncbi:unnamed protein product [Penicillium manginii]